MRVKGDIGSASSNYIVMAAIITQYSLTVEFSTALILNLENFKEKRFDFR